MKIVIATDSFKGCMSSQEIGDTLSQALFAKGHNSIVMPLSDGGDGMLDAFTKALGGRREKVRVHDPLMRLVDAEYGITDDGTAIIETAQACGLSLLSTEERNPIRTTTFGVGELVAHAILNGCKKFIVGLGGSGTSDAGIGMIRGLTERLGRGKMFDEIFKEKISGCQFILACDVTNPLYGPNGAASVFGPQKGATAGMIDILDTRARRFSETSARHFGYDKSGEHGAGAAGGLGYAFMQYLKAETQPRANLLLNLINFKEKIKDYDIIITGEGKADKQTLMGKLPMRVLNIALEQKVPAWLIAGRIEDKEQLQKAGFAKVVQISPEGLDTIEAMKKDITEENLNNFVDNNFSILTK